MAAGKRTIHLFHPTLAKGGGMERYAETLAVSFRKAGYPVTFHAQQVETAQARACDVEPNLLRIRSFPRKLRDLRFFRAVQEVRTSLSGPRIEISLWRAPARDLMICGGTHLGYLRRSRRWAGLFDRIQIQLEREAYRSARRVVSHSPLCTRELQDLYGLPESRITTLYPPVDEQFVPPASSAARKEAHRRFGLPQDSLVFLFPSTGHSRKGLIPIRKAISAAPPDVILAVAGNAPGSGGSQKVHYLGYIQNMADAYHAADFTILGSCYEPFGLVGPESLLCGTRLVFEKGIGCLTAIDPQQVTVFDVLDPASIQKAITESIRLARTNAHRVAEPAKALLYDPSPLRHAEALLELVQEPATSANS